MNCLVCGSANLETRDTIISDFVMARIDPHFDRSRMNRKTKLCFCKDCSFSFYEYRFTSEEESLLYKNYRDSEYQKTREKYECWYTKKVNDAINAGGTEMQQSRIKKSFSNKDIITFIQRSITGATRGATFCDELEKQMFIPLEKK